MSDVTDANDAGDVAHDAPSRRIVDWRQDDGGWWVAVLDCGHGRHMRHRPPWEVREWVLSQEGRAARLGIALRCAKCAAGVPV